MRFVVVDLARPDVPAREVTLAECIAHARRRQTPAQRAAFEALIERMDRECRGEVGR